MKKNNRLGTLDAQPEVRQKLNKTKKNRLLINFLLIVLIISITLLSPVFSVKQIYVSGINHLSDSKIISASGIKTGENTFLFRTSKVEGLIESLSFVDSAEVKRKLPGGVYINITECIPVAQISCTESLYAVIDNKGKILETSTERLKYSVPVVSDIAVNNVEVGERVSAKEEDVFNLILDIVNEIYDNDMWEKARKVYFSEGCYKIEYSDGIICDLANAKNIAYKIKFIKEAAEQIPEGKKGTFEFIDEYKAVFKPDER